MTCGVAEPREQQRGRQLAQAVEGGLHLGCDCFLSLAGEELCDDLFVTGLQLKKAVLHLPAIAGARGIQDAQDQVGDLGEGGNYDDYGAALLRVALHDCGCLPDPFGISDGSAAELHDHQAHGNPDAGKKLIW